MTSGGWQRAELNKTRGLNRDYNRRLKAIFKGAATAVLSHRIEPLYADYVRLTEQAPSRMRAIYQMKHDEKAIVS